jgi:SAM-dependent methyltransferase/polysaccharide pyruvyl transferase WcaK-like protein
MKRLASVDELNSPAFRSFMSWVNAFAQVHGLQVHTNWSMVWEYPWVWEQIRALPFWKTRILDIGSELSPMPWFFAALGANVTMVETDPSFVPKWSEIKELFGFSVCWELISGAALPMPQETFDAVTSFSVLEHIPDKQFAISEAVRVLKPGGLLCLTFDICEPSMGMTFPEWNSAALDMAAFDRLIWERDDLEPINSTALWNTEDLPAFVQWNLQSAPHHNYAVGGAVLRKRGIRLEQSRSASEQKPRIHLLDTGLGSGNIGDDAMFLGAYPGLSEFDLAVEVHSLEHARVLPPGARYLLMGDLPSVEDDIRSSDAALIVGDTPVMDQWGMEWPLRSNAGKLRLCHSLGKPVHAVGVGIDRLVNPEALEMFQEQYWPIASWSVRSLQCRRSLLDMGISEEKIILGADWAWLLEPRIDREWASEQLERHHPNPHKMNIGVNVVNEMWRDRKEIKTVLASFLDRLVERFEVQIFFFCNETRAGDYYDSAAADLVRSRMRHPSFLVDVRYYDPHQMISLISLMNVSISQRYHFTLFSVLADVVPISFQRGQKMKSLNEELGLPFVGDMIHLEEGRMEDEIAAALGDPGPRLRLLQNSRRHLKRRAANNLAWVRNAL